MVKVGSRLGAYDVLGSIGAGGMGEVYRAKDTRLKREVALKVLPADVAADPERLARFQREAELLASLNHPHIAHLHGLEDAPASGESGPVRALVMELVEGPTLADRLATGAVPVREAIVIARQLADALEYAHAHGIVHRDLKPANIKVGGGGPDEMSIVKVLDFGLAKAFDPAAATGEPGRGALANSPTITSPAMTMRGVILGTAAYMAPEQARGAAVDKRADIWAFGVVVYEMLTGARPFDGESASDTIAAVLRAHLDWTRLPADTPAALKTLLRRCLERDRRRRLQDIGDARIELDDLAQGTGFASVEAASATAAPPKATSRAPWALAAALTLLSAVLAWMAFVRSLGPLSVDNPALHWRFRMNTERLYEGGRSIALSPDGTTLAYAGAAPAGGRAVFVRKIDQPTARMLAGTEQAQELFFSPDGQWIGFSGGGLKKVPVNGGSPVHLSEMNANAGAVWARDGSIYFAPATGGNTPLFKVPASGGQPVAAARPGDGEIEFRHPELTEDDRTLLFTAVGPGQLRKIVAISLDTGQRTTVLEGAADPRVTGNGYLLVSQPGRVMAVPWDPARSEVTGDLTPFLDDVSTNEEMRATLTFARTGALAFVPGGATGAQSGRLILMDSRGVRTTAPGGPRAVWDPRVSPDGTRVAFDGRGEDIFVANLQTGASTRLSFSQEEDETPVWSPDGRRVAYSSTRGADRLIFLRNADGSGGEQEVFRVPNATGHIHLRDWSSDGATLLYEFRPSVDSQGYDIRALDLATGKDRTVVATPASETQARLSPGGRWMAYTANESGRDEIFVLAFPGGDGRWQVSAGGGVQPEWSADGSRLYFRHGGRIQMSLVTAGPTFAVSRPEPLTTFEDPGMSPTASGHAHWTRAGDRFLFFDGGADNASSEIQVVLGWKSLLPDLRTR